MSVSRNSWTGRRPGSPAVLTSEEEPGHTEPHGPHGTWGFGFSHRANAEVLRHRPDASSRTAQPDFILSVLGSMTSWLSYSTIREERSDKMIRFDEPRLTLYVSSRPLALDGFSQSKSNRFDHCWASATDRLAELKRSQERKAGGGGIQSCVSVSMSREPHQYFEITVRRLRARLMGGARPLHKKLPTSVESEPPDSITGVQGMRGKSLNNRTEPVSRDWRCLSSARPIDLSPSRPAYGQPCAACHKVRAKAG